MKPLLPFWNSVGVKNLSPGKKIRRINLRPYGQA